MADFECTCSVVKGERDVAYGEDCYCWYPKPNYNECVIRCRDCKRIGTFWKIRYEEQGSLRYEIREMDCIHSELNGFCAWGERRKDA